jgi:hypothetical protein
VSVSCDPTTSPRSQRVDASCGVHVWSNAFVSPVMETPQPLQNTAPQLTDVAVGRTEEECLRMQ